MKTPSENTIDILDRHICGLRIYRLEDPVRPTFISKNLCDMTGYTKREVSSETADGYAHLVHPADTGVYEDLKKRLLEGQKTCSAEYRILRKDGSVLYVRDTVNVSQNGDGTPEAYAVLTDITELKVTTENLRFLNETVPCGMLKFTCEKNPKITYINAQMMAFLRIPEVRDGELDYLEMYKENIYLLISIEYRRRFSHFLNQVNVNNESGSGELSVLRCDGTRARLYGWVTKVRTESGREEFQCVCMDITDKYRSKRNSETQRYREVLSDVYDKIFEYDFANRTMKYVTGVPEQFGKIRNLPLHMEEATKQLIDETVFREDRAAMREFFSTALAQRANYFGGKPPQIRYRAIEGTGEVQTYTGVFLRIDSNVALFCCKRISDGSEVDTLRSENVSLKTRNETMQDMMLRYTDGIAAFEVVDDSVTPLYASDNVCNFFGFSREEWFALMQQSTSIKDFVSRSAVGYEKFMELFRNGKAEFTYFDVSLGTEQRIRAVCSQQNADRTIPRYVLLYKLDSDGKKANDADAPRIFIRTFGYFDVFVNDNPIAFRNKKAKELLALLVDRRGGYVTSEEAIGYLWENESANAVTLARYRKEALRLKNTLEEYGIGGILESVDGKRRVIPEKVECDLYNYLSDKEEHARLFKGSYLINYTWGEMTLGELMNGKTME